MTVPTTCRIVTSRNDCFCPEKSSGEMHLRVVDADREKARLDRLTGCTHHVVPCIIMPVETFEELCPDWAKLPVDFDSIEQRISDQLFATCERLGADRAAIAAWPDDKRRQFIAENIDS